MINRYSVSVLIVIFIAVAATIYFLVPNGEADASQSPATTSQLPQKTPGNPRFSFMGASGWRQGPTDKVSMALFNDGDCFTTVETKTGSVNIDHQLKKSQATLAKMGYGSTPIGVLNMKLQTNAGSHTYQLHQYKASGAPGDRAIKGGQELGYLNLKNSYIKVTANCDSTDELPATIPALQAIKFNGK